MYIFTNKNNFQEKHINLINILITPTCILFVVSTFYKVYKDKIQVFLFLIPDLKRSIVYASFIFAGTFSQIFGTKQLILSIPKFTEIIGDL